MAQSITTMKANSLMLAKGTITTIDGEGRTTTKVETTRITTILLISNRTMRMMNLQLIDCSLTMGDSLA